MVLCPQIVNQAFDEGIIKGKILAFAPIPGTMDASVNVTRTNTDYRDAQQLSEGLREGRQQISSIVAFIKKKIPGCDKAYLSNIAPIMGIRASVKLDGRSTLKLSDISNLREFDDCVGVGCYPV